MRKIKKILKTHEIFIFIINKKVIGLKQNIEENTKKVKENTKQLTDC